MHLTSLPFNTMANLIFNHEMAFTQLTAQTPKSRYIRNNSLPMRRFAIASENLAPFKNAQIERPSINQSPEVKVRIWFRKMKSFLKMNTSSDLDQDRLLIFCTLFIHIA
jgi:hypothetical protein